MGGRAFGACKGEHRHAQAVRGATQGLFAEEELRLLACLLAPFLRVQLDVFEKHNFTVRNRAQMNEITSTEIICFLAKDIQVII